jgi:hypothetical protein
MGIEPAPAEHDRAGKQASDRVPFGRQPSTAEAPTAQSASSAASTAGEVADRHALLVESLRAAIAAAANAGEFALTRQLLDLLEPIVLGARPRSREEG